MLWSLPLWACESGELARWLDRLWEGHRHGAKYFEVTRSDGNLPEDWPDRSEAERSRWPDNDFRHIWERKVLENERDLRNGLAHRTAPFITVAHRFIAGDCTLGRAD